MCSSDLVGLWVRGAADLNQLAANAVAVVGSRAATDYGTHQATELSRDLAAMGHTVVSGLAYGVDQAAHRGALLAGGPTIAVMPCGGDRPYPAAHAQLLEVIADRGLVVAEAPPGTAPTRARFLARNRIVAGLSEGTVVVEGAFRSGALTTAQWTNALHRPVMGVPGPVTSAASAGVNQLVRLGQASLVTNAQEVITDLTTHAYSAAAAQLDESLIPGPVRSAQTHIPGPPAPAAAPRR